MIKINKVNYYLLTCLILITFIAFLFVAKTIYEKYFHNYYICFTPTENCAIKIVDEINSSKKSIYVMAYGFTSDEITGALLNAKHRDVNVNVILDKSNVGKKKVIPKLFTDSEIPIYIDYKPPISHNKVMIIDGHTVITGSYNFTGNAKKNAENVIFIFNRNIANEYLNNWMSRYQKSLSFQKYINQKSR